MVDIFHKLVAPLNIFFNIADLQRFQFTLK